MVCPFPALIQTKVQGNAMPVNPALGSYVASDHVPYTTNASGASTIHVQSYLPSSSSHVAHRDCDSVMQSLVWILPRCGAAGPYNASSVPKKDTSSETTFLWLHLCCTDSTSVRNASFAQAKSARASGQRGTVKHGHHGRAEESDLALSAGAAC